MHISDGLVRNRESMNRWTFFSTHGIVPRGLEDAGEEKTTSQPAKAAAIPCRRKRGGACARVLYHRAGIASGACPVRPQRPLPLDDSTLQRPHSACCHRLRRLDGMRGWHRRIGCQLRLHRGAVTPISTIGSRSRRGKRGLPQSRKRAHTQTREGCTDDDD